MEVADKAHPKPPSLPATPTVKLGLAVRPVAPASPAPVPSTSSRPIIKLKVGGSALNGTPTPSAETPTPKISLKPPKGKNPKEPKTREIPRPETAYIDDGSADLLEEVIAIEKEKDEELHRKNQLVKVKEVKEPVKVKVKAKEKVKETPGKPRLVIGKRKATTETKADEDEILALAGPAKKERSAPSSPPAPGPPSLPPVSEKPKVVAPAPSTNRNGVHKGKDKALRPNHTPPDRREEAKNSTKGKERDVSSSSINHTAIKKSPPQISAPHKGKGSGSSSPAPTVTPINEKKCRDVLKTLTKNPDARIFLIPVDPNRDGCPT